MDSPQHEFHQITRLLHLKRFEVPPPGFHHRFRARVMTRIEMERDWAEQPWWQRALSTLTWQRGLAVANGVALAGVAFLGVATFHIAHTVVNEEEEVQIYAALPLPGMATSPVGDDRMSQDIVLAEANASGFVARSDRSAQSILIPVAEELSVPPSSPAALDDSSPPAWLFDAPSRQAKKPSTPRFILPGDRRSLSRSR